MGHSVSTIFFVPFVCNEYWMDDTSGSSVTSKISSTEEACECSYDSLRRKILDASLKLDGAVFDRFNIDLTRVKVWIKELWNDEFDHFRLGFDSSHPKKNVSFSLDSTSDFSRIMFSICFKDSTMGLKCLPNAMSSFILPTFKAWYFLSNRITRFCNLLRYPLTIFNLLVHVDNMPMYC